MTGDLLGGGDWRPCRRLQSGGPSAATTDAAGRHSAAGARRRSRPRRFHSSDRSDLRRGENCLPARHIPPSGRDRADRRPRRHVQRRWRQRADDRSGGHIQQSICVESPIYSMDKTQRPHNAVLSFNSVTAVENYYGATSSEASLAKEFFAANYGDTSATMLFTRFGLGQRPHLLGANISNLTLNQLQSINGSLALTFDGYTYSGHDQSLGRHEFLDAAGKIRAALNRNLQVAAVTAGSSITPESVSFTGYAQWSTSLRHVGLVRQH